MNKRELNQTGFVSLTRLATFGHLIIISGILTMGTMPAALSMAREEIDLSRWTERRIVLAPFQLTFKVPPGRAEAYGNPLIVSAISLDREPIEPARAVPLFKQAWSYDKSFWRGTMGSLQMIVALERSDGSLGRDTQFVNLQRMIRDSLEAYYIPHTERVRRQGREDLVVHLPKSFDTTTINGRQWLTYKLSGWKDETFYVTPLTDEKYLSMSFDFIDNTRGYRSAWRKEAQAVSDEIRKSTIIKTETE